MKNPLELELQLKIKKVNYSLFRPIASLPPNNTQKLSGTTLKAFISMNKIEPTMKVSPNNLRPYYTLSEAILTLSISIQKLQSKISKKVSTSIHTVP